MREMIAVVAAAACGPATQQGPGAPMTHNACATAIRNLAAGKVADAQLPAGCTLAEAVAALEPLARARDASGSLGSERVQVKWRAIDRGVAGERLLVWHDGTHVLAVELEGPHVAGGWDALRAALGEPDAKLAYWNGVVEDAQGQWLYPARGLALYTKLAATELGRVIAFPPTTLDHYRNRLARATEPPREFEDR
jgi:hypothetical protein